MSPIAAWLFAAFTALQGPAEVEDPAARTARIETVATAIASESNNLEEAALEAATVWEESQRLSYAVHSGAKRGDHGRSVCLGQVQAQPFEGLLPVAEWRTLTGVDSAATRRCVAASIRILRHMGEHCGGSSLQQRYARQIAAYATGRGCNPALWSGSYPRAQRALWFLRRAPSAAVACTADTPCAFASLEPLTADRHKRTIWG